MNAPPQQFPGHPSPRKRFNVILLLTVILPTAMTILYYGVIAADGYISESRLVVRSPQHKAQSGLGALRQGPGISWCRDVQVRELAHKAQLA